MKGGITSGVVYPGAVVRLAKRYRFRSIGGTSAGALAAAAVAAAEHGRTTGGFARLSEVPGELGGHVDGRPFILSLFQPDPGTRRLFAAALAFQQHGLVRGTLATLRSFWRFPLVGAAWAALAVVLAGTGVLGWVPAVALLALVPWIVLLGVLRDAAVAFSALAENDFGLCRLGPGDGETPALTLWLHDLVQRLAGRRRDDAVLTFGDLWGVPPLREDASETELDERRKRRDLLSWNTSERAIDLQVVTTNLTVGRPLRLPMLRDRWRESFDDGGLLFDPHEWRAFFPAAVVRHLVSVATEPEGVAADVLRTKAPGRELLYFPGGADLPVVVAARMSLSFPVLVSTVPLWQIQHRPGGDHRLRRMVFSDGGISSNFPVHLFDSPLPTRPTFALNLAGFEADEDPDLDAPSDCVRDPAAVTGQAVETWQDPQTMFGFFVSIKDAMENWRDNAQARMPGFRERVIHIRLGKGEGGLNLAMDARKVKRLIDRGEYAAERLIEVFSGPENGSPQRTAHWNDHRFARFRVVMSALERFFAQLERGYTSPPDATSVPYPARISDGSEGPYALSPDGLSAATRTLRDYLAIADEVTATLDDDRVPHPKASARMTPPL